VARTRNPWQRHFEQVADYPGLVSFWWPRFRRIARWMAEKEPEFRRDVARIARRDVGRDRVSMIKASPSASAAAPTASISDR
jgi:hypothetical protein